jgi:hypothetical protein
MSDGEPGRMTNPTPPVVRHEVFLLAEVACTCTISRDAGDAQDENLGV